MQENNQGHTSYALRQVGMWEQLAEGCEAMGNRSTGRSLHVELNTSCSRRTEAYPGGPRHGSSQCFLNKWLFCSK